MKEFKYKTSFSAKLTPVISADKDKYLSIASLENLKKFIPDINLELNPDLLPIAGNAFVANTINANDDGVTTKEALILADLFPLKFIDYNHNRKHVLGVITTVSFTEFGSNRELSRKEVEAYTKPFNVCLGGLLWRIVEPEVIDYIEESGNPNSEYYEEFSLSWEVMFAESHLVELDRSNNIEDGLIITDPEKISELEGRLRCNGGNGKTDNGKRLGRIIVGNCIPIAVGIVNSPAAAVKGLAIAGLNKEIPPEITEIANKQGWDKILTILKTMEIKAQTMCCPDCGEQDDIEMDDAEAQKTCAKCGKSNAGKNWKPGVDIEKKEETSANSQEKNQNKSSTSEILVVNKNSIAMDKITQLSEITDESLKQVKASSIHEFVATELQKACLEHDKRVKDAEAVAQNAESARVSIEAKHNELAATIETLKVKLAEFEKERTERLASETLNVRMASLDEKFNLTAEDRKEIVADVKGLEDTAFDAYVKKMSVLLSHKLKSNDAQVVVASVTSPDAAIDKALDNGKVEPAVIPNGGPVTEPTFREKYQKAFATDGFVLVDSKKKSHEIK